jgi:hypothetical protein
MDDVIELKRAKPPDQTDGEGGLARPQAAAPKASASATERERWSQVFVAWFLSMTGGDLNPDGGPAGYRWRIEYFDCVRDPEAFERRAEQEIEIYKTRGGK